MIMKSSERDVLCPVGSDLLVRFKQGGGTQVPAGAVRALAGTRGARASDFQKTEKDVRITCCINECFEIQRL